MSSLEPNSRVLLVEPPSYRFFGDARSHPDVRSAIREAEVAINAAAMKQAPTHTVVPIIVIHVDRGGRTVWRQEVT
jgi:hypothetical protein